MGAGGEARRVAEKGLVPRYSPDGRSIAYLTVSGSLEARHQRAYLVSPQGGEPRQILSGFSFGYATQGASPVWSPDGKYLLFHGRRVDEPGSADWWVAPVDGGDAVRTHAVENLGLETIVQFPVAWSGDDVYFASGTTIEGINLFRAQIAHDPWTIKGPAVPITTGPGMKISASIARDGRIFFENITTAMAAWSVAARPDAAVVSASPQRVARDAMQNFSPAISRDGATAAFLAFGGAHSGRVEVRTTDLRTGHVRTIPVQGLDLSVWPEVSDDGSLVAYRNVLDGKPRSFVVGPGTTPGREVCADCVVRDFFPGNEFVLIRTTPNHLEKLNLRTGDRSPVLASAGETIADARLSTDGQWVVWLAAMDDGKAAIRVAPVETGGADRQPMTVAESDKYLGSPAWSPNDRWLYYLSQKGAGCKLVARELEPRTKAPIGEERGISLNLDRRLLLNFPMGIGTIGIGADRIIFEATEVGGNIYMARPVAPK